MASSVKKFVNIPVYNIPDDTPTEIRFGNRETPGLPSTSCARIRGVKLRKKHEEDVLQPVQLNDNSNREQITQEKTMEDALQLPEIADESSKENHTSDLKIAFHKGGKVDVCHSIMGAHKSLIHQEGVDPMHDISTTSKKKDITIGNLSQLEMSRIEDIILEYQLKYERLNSIMKKTQNQIVESQDERTKFLDVYDTCVKDLKGELFKKETDLYRCQQELDNVKLELQKARAENAEMKENFKKESDLYRYQQELDNLKMELQQARTENVEMKENFRKEIESLRSQEELDNLNLELQQARAEISKMKENEKKQDNDAVPIGDTSMSCKSGVKNVSLISESKMIDCSKTGTGEIPRTPVDKQENFADVSIVSRKGAIVNSSLADLKSPMMTPRTPRGHSRKSRRSSLYQFISKNTCETENKDEILKETIIDLKEVLDCYATLTGLSVSVDKCPERQNKTISQIYFNLKTNTHVLHKDFEISLGIDDAYDEIEYTPTYLENPDVDPGLVQKLPNCLKEKAYISTDQGSLFLGDVLRFVRL